MTTKMIQAYQHTCERCEHVWASKLENPKNCPSCKSPYWNKERAARRFAEVYTLPVGGSMLIPWPAGFVSGTSRIHPIVRVVRKLNKEGKNYHASFTVDGAIVTRATDRIADLGLKTHFSEK